MAEKITRADIDELPPSIGDDELDALFDSLKQKASLRRAPIQQTMPKAKFVPSQLTADDVTAITDSQEAMHRSMVEWQQILAPECGVYNTKYGYLVREFDNVAYEYIGNDDNEARRYAQHNLVALLRYKYFKVITDESQTQIDKIVKWFCANIYNNICYVTIDKDDPIKQSLRLDTLPSSAVAFANGIYDFKENKFILKYERIRIPSIANTMVMYNKYLILWYFNYDFEPLDVDINTVSFEDFCKSLKAAEPTKANLTWQLFSNMSHDKLDQITPQRMIHLSEILGYTIMAPLVQSFVILIGSGQNGKNSIYDGAFSAFVSPAPGQESLDSIETDRFIGGTLRGLSHNICLETVPGVKRSSDQLKKLTGSGEFATEEKGKTKTTIPMNCKFIFSGNDQNNIKFSDRSHGFDRRCNLFELYYRWSADHSFMNNNPDYYPCDFTLRDISDHVENNKIFVYLGMYGIKSATRNFTRDFTFTYNEWNESYTDTNYDILEFFSNELTPEMLFRSWNNASMPISDRIQECAFCIQDRAAITGYSRLQTSKIIEREFGKMKWQDLAIKFKQYNTLVDYDSDGNEIVAQELAGVTFFSSNPLYVSLEFLREIFKSAKPNFNKSNYDFNEDFRKALHISNTARLAFNKAYVKIRMFNGKVVFSNAL